jgi:hypothetical protein
MSYTENVVKVHALKMAKSFTTGRCSMGYIHCCGALHKSRTFRLVPQDKFLLCEVDYLSKCPVCGHTVVQLTRIDNSDNISVVRKINKKAKLFFEKLKQKILYEIKPENYSRISSGSFYLNYNEYGVKKRCYSNLRTLKIGRSENKYLKLNP